MDVLERVLPSIGKFWSDCPYPIYVGLNTPRKVAPQMTTLIAQLSEWRMECLEQVAQIPETHLIVVLDDFLFQDPVDQRRLTKLVSVALRSNISYLRLVPLGKSLLDHAFSFVPTPSEVGIQAVKSARPFYSGLQIALWNRAHFTSLLQLPGSIWDFEHQRMVDVPHYVITGRPPISYSHLVDKGRWLPYAKSLLSRVGLPEDLGARQVWPRWINVRFMLEKVRLLVFGDAIN
jgi:hypothetical protein